MARDVDGLSFMVYGCNPSSIDGIYFIVLSFYPRSGDESLCWNVLGRPSGLCRCRSRPGPDGFIVHYEAACRFVYGFVMVLIVVIKFYGFVMIFDRYYKKFYRLETGVWRLGWLGRGFPVLRPGLCCAGCLAMVCANLLLCLGCVLI